jgi:tRNA modification GTPase
MVVGNKYDLVSGSEDIGEEPGSEVANGGGEAAELSWDVGKNGSSQRAAVDEHLVEEGLAEDVFYISARMGMADERIVLPVLQAIVGTVRAQGATNEESEVVTNERHRFHLDRAVRAVKRARVGLSDGATNDLLSQDLRVAMEELGAITGATANEDVLDRIFSRFCIGK